MLNCYLTDSVTIVRLPSPPTDEWGENLTATEYARVGRVEWKTHLVRDLEGEEVVSSGTVMMAYDSALTVKDKLKYGGVTYTILRVEEMRDFARRGLLVHLQ